MCWVLFKEERLQCTMKAVDMHVWLMQIVTEQVSMVQRQRRCGRHMCPAETLEQQVDGN